VDYKTIYNQTENRNRAAFATLLLSVLGYKVRNPRGYAARRRSSTLLSFAFIGLDKLAVVPYRLSPLTLRPLSILFQAHQKHISVFASILVVPLYASKRLVIAY